MKWKDETSYSRGERAKGAPPSLWRTQVAWLRISVHRHIHFEEDRWLLSTVPSIFDLSMLESKDIEEAKKEALAKIRKDFNKVLKGLG